MHYEKKTVVFITGRCSNRSTEKSCATNPWRNSFSFCRVFVRRLKTRHSRQTQHPFKWALTGHSKAGGTRLAPAAKAVARSRKGSHFFFRRLSAWNLQAFDFKGRSRDLRGQSRTGRFGSQFRMRKRPLNGLFNVHSRGA